MRQFLWRRQFPRCSLRKAVAWVQFKVATPPDMEGKTKKEEIFFSKLKIYCSNISFCFYSLLAAPSLHIAIGCLSVALIRAHTHGIFVNYHYLRRNGEVLC